MLAIQTPSPSALITPARRDRPRPAATVRSASGPRPNTRRPPSGTPTTSPAGVLTRAAGDAACPTPIAFLSCPPVLSLLERTARGRGGETATPVTRILEPTAAQARSPSPGIAVWSRPRLAMTQPGASARNGSLVGLPWWQAGPCRGRPRYGFGCTRIRLAASSWDSPGGLRQAGIPCRPGQGGQGGKDSPAGPAPRTGPGPAGLLYPGA